MESRRPDQLFRPERALVPCYRAELNQGHRQSGHNLGHTTRLGRRKYASNWAEAVARYWDSGSYTTARRCWRGLTGMRPAIDYWDRYAKMATELGFEGHMAMAEAMP